MIDEQLKEKGSVLTEETVSFGGMLLEYRLLFCNTYSDRFHIWVGKGEESAECGVGNDMEAALRHYRSVVRGRVTPCGLEDVMYDLRRAE